MQTLRPNKARNMSNPATVKPAQAFIFSEFISRKNIELSFDLRIERELNVLD